jgi:hypothetical protein
MIPNPHPKLSMPPSPIARCYQSRCEDNSINLLKIHKFGQSVSKGTVWTIPAPAADHRDRLLSTDTLAARQTQDETEPRPLHGRAARTP